MSWLFGSGNRKTPTGQSDIRAARDRQISNLKDRVPGLLLKSTDNSLNEVQITAPDGAKVILRVFLPTKFPSDRPGEHTFHAFVSVRFHRLTLSSTRKGLVVQHVATCRFRTTCSGNRVPRKFMPTLRCCCCYSASSFQHLFCCRNKFRTA